MEFDAEIDAELNALSDCSTEDLLFSEDEKEIIDTVEEKNAVIDYDPSQGNWMKLFLDRTYKQAKNIEINLSDADIVLKEIDRNVVECHSRALSVIENEESRLKTISGSHEIFLDIFENEQIADAQVTSLVNAEDSKDVSTLHQEKTSYDDPSIDPQKLETDKRIREFEASCKEEFLHRIDDIEVKRLATEKHLQLLEEEERKILDDLNQQKLFYENERKNKSACLIQSLFRRYSVRKQYGSTIDKLLRNSKERRFQERIRIVEEKRRKQVSSAPKEITVQPISNDLSINKLDKESRAFENSNAQQSVDVSEDVKEVNTSDTVPSERNSVCQIDHTFITEDEANTEFSQILSGPTSLNSSLCKDIEPAVSETLSINQQSASYMSSDGFDESADYHFVQNKTESNYSPKNENVDQVVKKSNDNLLDHNAFSQMSSELLSQPSSPYSEPISDALVTGAVKTNVTNEIAEEKCIDSTSDRTKQSLPTDKDDGNVLTLIKQDLKVLEQSVVLDDATTSGDGNVNTCHSVVKHKPKVLKSCPNAAKELLQTIDNDLSRLQASVNLGSSTQQTKQIEKSNAVQSDIDEKSIEIKKGSSDSTDAQVQNFENSFTVTDIQQKENDVKCTSPLLRIMTAQEITDGAQKAKASLEISNNAIHTAKVITLESDVENTTYTEVCASEIASTCSISPDHIVVTSSDQDSSIDKMTSQDMDGFSNTEFLKDFQTVSDPSSSPSTVVSDGGAIGRPEPTDKSEFNEQKCKVQKSGNSTDDRSLLKHNDIPEVTDHAYREKDATSVHPTNAKTSSLYSSEEIVPALKPSNPSRMLNDPDTTSILPSHPRKSKDDHFGSPVNSKQEKQDCITNSFSEDEVKSESRALTHETQPKSLFKDHPGTLWKKWKKQCLPWEINVTKSIKKPHLKRAIRKSSAAKKLPPLSTEEIVKAKWPFHKDLVKERSLETVSRIYIFCIDNNDGRNLINVQRCSNLTHLTLVRCGLVSLEGLHTCPSLRHIDISYNSVSVISCDNMKRLESLVAAGNRLTSIHGLSGCNSLLLLDMSKNNITKLTGLDTLQNLAHLRLANNQLMNVRGLNTVNSLISLDVSFNNLSNLDGIENCGLMRLLNASNNCFKEIPARNLTNLVLLVDLTLSSNSITNLSVTLNESQHLFLPMLTHLHLQQNKISFEEGLECSSFSESMPQLHALNLSQNLIADSDSAINHLVPMSHLKQLFLSENLFSEQQQELIFKNSQQCNVAVSFQDDIIVTSPSKTSAAINDLLSLPSFSSVPSVIAENNSDPYLYMATKQLNEYVDLVLREKKELKNLRGWKLSSVENAAGNQIPPDLFSYHCDYLRKHSESAIQQRHFCVDEMRISMAASSAPLDRVFRHAGELCSAKRTNLDLGIFAIFMLMRKNPDFERRYREDLIFYHLALNCPTTYDSIESAIAGTYSRPLVETVEIARLLGLRGVIPNPHQHHAKRVDRPPLTRFVLLIQEGQHVHCENTSDHEAGSVDSEKKLLDLSKIPPSHDPIMDNSLFLGNEELCSTPRTGLSERNYRETKSVGDFFNRNFSAIPSNSVPQPPCESQSQLNSLQSISSYSALERICAIKIQKTWRNHVAWRDCEIKRRLNASVIIQAAWRGHVVRRNLQNAFASFNTTGDIEIDEFEEVDLTQLEFDEKVYDQQWAVKTNKPIHLLSTPPIAVPPPPTRSYSAGAARRQFVKSVTPTPQTFDDSHNVNDGIKMGNTQNIWQKIASLSKPPLPPITPTNSDAGTHQLHMTGVCSTSDLDSHRSKHSRKEEVLANEWGLHDSAAVELMLKRAKRMKGRKKKQVNAEEKLRRFQDLKQRVTEKPMTSLRKPAQAPNRMEYFKAREVEFENRERKHSEDDERRRQYTYEWLHTRADVSTTDTVQVPSRGHHPSPHNAARRHQSDSGSVKSGFLPDIRQHRSIMSPKQQNDLEILSLSSHNSNQVRSKQLLQDIAKRHGDLDSGVL